MTVLTEVIKNGKVEITIEGHAGFKTKNDIVCAGASILMYTMVENLESEGHVKIDDSIPRTEIVFPATEENLLKYRALKKGFELLAEAYPDYVKVGAK